MDITASIANAPALLPVFPQYAKQTKKLCQFLEILHEQAYPAMEILCRPLPEALESLKALNDCSARNLVSIGLGTVRTEKDACAAVKVKPDFLVSAAFSRRVLAVAAEAAIPYIPVVSSLQDIQDVWEAFEDFGLELSVLKLCPVEGMTPNYIRCLCGCFPGITFCPTGTVPIKDIPRWRAIPGIGASIESKYVPGELIEQGDWAQVRQRLQCIKQLTSCLV